MFIAVAAVLPSGCTCPRDYFRQNFKVGPNYCPPTAHAAQHWIDSADRRVRSEPADLSRWWTVFNDATLNQLVERAYGQNLTLREAGFRILQARAQLGIITGELFPQTQKLTGSYKRVGVGNSSANSSSVVGASGFSDQWNFGFTLQWELDFWGRFRRAVAAQEATLEASVYDYDYVLVTLLGDVATNYTQARTYQERIRLLKGNVAVQKHVLEFIENRYNAGRVGKLDVDQARSDLAQTEAGVPQLEISLRQATNRLCVLLGMPPCDLQCLIGEGAIPVAPEEVVVGVPCDLVRRRPDVREAERKVAAQAEQIGIAEADFYPAFFINGTLGYQARNFSHLFSSNALNSNIGPSFDWKILNYGRLVNGVRLEEAMLQELVVAYQQTVLNANEEAENGLVTFLRAQERARLLSESVVAAQSAVDIVVSQLQQGAVDFNRYATIEQNMVTQQDSYAQARGQIADGLIAVYRALGGGWEIRLNDQGDANQPAEPTTAPPEAQPAPDPPALESPAEPPKPQDAAPQAPTSAKSL
jgi:NodT family efflux transporter outer membrane factor (OMF) lipoprotein